MLSGSEGARRPKTLPQPQRHQHSTLPKPHLPNSRKTRILEQQFREVGVFPVFNRSDRATAEKPGKKAHTDLTP